MSKFVEGLKSLFSNDAADNAAAEARKAREGQQVQLARQQSEGQRERALLDQEGGRARRAPPGRRLLLAATGEGGVTKRSLG